MSLDRILTNQNITRRNKLLPKIALAFSMALAVPTFFAAKYLTEIINPEKKYETILKNDERSITKGKISLNIDGKIENFTYSPEKVGSKELNSGIIVWEKIATDVYPDVKINYPIGHLYVFKDIKTRNIVGKFAVSGGDLNHYIHSMKKGVYVLNKFELYPPFVNELGEIICERGSPENPWGYGRFYHYPTKGKEKTMEKLLKKSLERYTTPDKLQRYLHGGAFPYEGYNGGTDYELRGKELQETNFQPTHTIGCIKTSNDGMNFLEERINPGVFRLAYVDNIRN